MGEGRGASEPSPATRPPASSTSPDAALPRHLPAHGQYRS